ncbi:apolipoprotein N-acyltransferase [Botrimarina sp.]|uniref:apolipoprotein N-acyltransferase n=1 Tax=Botrimarina sp. TaxID=2795802 RepID=UPI0032EDBE3F
MTIPSTDAPDPPPADPKRVLLRAAAAAVVLWLAQPPVGWQPLAWLSLAIWADLAASPRRWGRTAYAAVWLAGVLYWLLAVWWVTLPHPLTKFGWPILAMYLGLYTAAPVVVARAAYRRWRAPVWIALPIAWTGFELVQARLFTGFLMGAVSHSQSEQGWLRSIAAYTGAYGVTFCVVIVGSLLAAAVRARGAKQLVTRWAGVLAAAACVAAAGWAARSSLPLRQGSDDPPTVALIQGDSRAVWDADPAEKNRRIMDRQTALTLEAISQAAAGVDLVVWPESMFRPPIVTYGGAFEPGGSAEPDEIAAVANTRVWLQSLAERAGGAWLLMGADRFEQGGDRPSVYNSVVLVGPDGRLTASYDKNHLVPFGEYIPLASGLPALYYLTPISGGLSSGDGPVGMTLEHGDGETFALCPTICYETVVPHVVRSHVAYLTRQEQRPDALVNVTNDAWFWGSSELPMHLACGQFRAVENGLPMLVAANGGLSAVVDATGAVVAVTEPMTEAVIVHSVPPSTRQPTLYSRWGDWFAGGCLGLTTLAAVGVLASRRGATRRQRPRAASEAEPTA